MSRKLGYGIGAAVIVAVVAIGLWFGLRHPAAPPKPVAAPVPAAAPAPADCPSPGAPPALPNGATATEAQMKAGHDAIQAFVNKLQDYQTCRDNQADHAAPSVTAQQKDAWIAQGDGAIDEANLLAAAYKVEMETFKARTPPPPK